MIWRDITGYEELYQVSETGHIRSLRKGLLLSPCLSNGYPAVALYKDKKQRMIKIHRLVAMAFIPNPENKPEVNHIDRNRQNNNVDNLEWMTHTENSKHAAVDEAENELAIWKLLAFLPHLC